MARRESGFTLLELMIAVVIMGILAAIAITSYSSYACRAKQAVAHTALKNLQLAEERYRSRVGSYTQSISDLPGIDEYTQNPPYHLVITNASDISFNARAECKPNDGCAIAGSTDNDIWSIDQNGNLQVVENACR